MQIFHPDQQISIGGAREFVRPGRGQFNLCQMISYGIFNIEICLYLRSKFGSRTDELNGKRLTMFQMKRQQR